MTEARVVERGEMSFHNESKPSRAPIEIPTVVFYRFALNVDLQYTKIYVMSRMTILSRIYCINNPRRIRLQFVETLLKFVT